jgi:hypothetical protein
VTTRIPDTPGESGVLIHDDIHSCMDDTSYMGLITKGFQSFGKNKIPTFMDSGISDTMFVSKESFVKYKATPPHTGDLAKAVDGGFEIIGKGKVIQRYLIEGETNHIYPCTSYPYAECQSHLD